mmetsp:Transcript_40210/g.67044  ORF Transcript_40210/g.67044 Transcript_40210/m.67044 type:complete len:89 (+) Transcript_40210:38-304(+)
MKTHLSNADGCAHQFGKVHKDAFDKKRTTTTTTVRCAVCNAKEIASAEIRKTGGLYTMDMLGDAQRTCIEKIHCTSHTHATTSNGKNC